jgi:hypothetical protein
VADHPAAAGGRVICDQVIGHPARRHMNATQKAWVAANSIEVFREKAHERQGARTDISENLREGDEGKASDQVGKAFSVSGRLVEHALAVIAKGSEALKEMVARGEVAG